ncbi:hypothetical protein STAL104432_27915 [Streptomyces albus]
MSERPQPPVRIYYCECYVNERRIGTYDAYSPREALRWIRISLMMIATTLDEAPTAEPAHGSTTANQQQPTTSNKADRTPSHSSSAAPRPLGQSAR